MKSFRELQQDKKNAQNAPSDQKESAGKQSVESLMGKSESELTELLMREAAKAKAEGTLSEDTLRAFAEQAAPLLTPEQRAKMEALLRLIQ